MSNSNSSLQLTLETPLQNAGNALQNAPRKKDGQRAAFSLPAL